MQTLTAPAHPAAVALPAMKHRITSIDFLRGLVMVIMALDHVRDFFHIEGMTGNPTDLATTTPALFFTRWITHYCAPIFVFLAGTSAFLSGQRKTKKELSLFLLTRGFWLVLMEVFIVSLGWTFNPFYNAVVMQVIWAIGVSMMLLSALIWLPFKLILALGLVIVFGHNLLDYPEAERNGQVGMFWDLAHRSRFSAYTIAPGHVILFAYAFMPWTGVMMLGYCFGSLYRKGVPVAYRKKVLLRLGIAAIVSFIVLRFINQYGDPAPWSEQKNGTYTLLSFLNVSKYPPSLMYTLMTIGPGILFLSFFESMQSRFSKFFITFGRVPFFYYLLHVYLIHLICLVLFFASGYGAEDIVSPSPFLFRPLEFGYNLWIVYVIWIGVIAILYPLCKKYNRYKSTHHHWMLSYL